MQAPGCAVQLAAAFDANDTWLARSRCQRLVRRPAATLPALSPAAIQARTRASTAACANSDRSYFAAAAVWFASVYRRIASRNGWASGGAGVAPVSRVLNGIMWP